MANVFESMTDERLDATITDLEGEIERLRFRDLTLDMTRGKPCPEQENLSRPMLDVLTSTSDLANQMVDAANYGAPDGIPSARRLMASVLEVDSQSVIITGSSSLNIMYDIVTNAWLHGIRGAEPWGKQALRAPVKFLCPSPGYDRHFLVTERVGFHNVAVAMTPDGPDMDEVASYVEHDPTVKGIWCVPKYSNPTGVTYSDATVRRFASLKPAAPDFRVFWDNAYVVHDFTDRPDELLEIFGAVAAAGNDDLIYEFASTSKITFAGSGIACVAASAADLAEIKSWLSVERVCGNKLNELMHARFLRNKEGVLAHMARHATQLRPRFALVEKKLTEGLGSLGCGTWSHPRGGYFVSFDGPEGSAKRIVALAAELGVRLTAAGATWPGRHDPRDTNIRIAPTYPSPDDLTDALDVFVVCVSYVCAQLVREARMKKAGAPEVSELDSTGHVPQTR